MDKVFQELKVVNEGFHRHDISSYYMYWWCRGSSEAVGMMYRPNKPFRNTHNNEKQVGIVRFCLLCGNYIRFGIEKLPFNKYIDCGCKTTKVYSFDRWKIELRTEDIH